MLAGRAGRGALRRSGSRSRRSRSGPWSGRRVPAGAAARRIASVACGDGLPKTLVMSPVGPVPVFSSTMLAVATAPTSQPARVYGTHGAGAFAPVGVIMFGTVGVFGAETGSVQ